MKNTKRLAILAFAIMLVFTGMIRCASSEENVTTGEALERSTPCKCTSKIIPDNSQRRLWTQ